MADISLVTIIIIAANVIISLKGFNDYSFFEKYKFNTAAIGRGDYFRMFSSAFLHVNNMHLLFNMITLYFFAEVVIRALGQGTFLLIYVLSFLAGNFLSYYFHKSNLNYNAVGASGGVMGVLYSAIIFYPDMPLYFFFIPIAIPAWFVGIGYLLYSIYGMKKQLGNIGHDAHFGGAIAGYVLTLFFAPHLFETQMWIIILLAIPILILLAMQRMGKL
jgi:membrane associated rhomboid family serine protease